MKQDNQGNSIRKPTAVSQARLEGRDADDDKLTCDAWPRIQIALKTVKVYSKQRQDEDMVFIWNIVSACSAV